MENILIIEHEDHVRNELGSYSERLGYKPILISEPLICKAANSELKQCPTKKPCAEFLLIDKDCPEIDGLSLIELQTRKGCSVQVKQKALMASKLTDEENEKTFTLGCHVISKSVTFQDLESWLNRPGESSE